MNTQKEILIELEALLKKMAPFLTVADCDEAIKALATRENIIRRNRWNSGVNAKTNSPVYKSYINRETNLRHSKVFMQFIKENLHAIHGAKGQGGHSAVPRVTAEAQEDPCDDNSYGRPSNTRPSE